jgi:hypothetical protein
MCLRVLSSRDIDFDKERRGDLRVTMHSGLSHGSVYTYTTTRRPSRADKSPHVLVWFMNVTATQKGNDFLIEVWLVSVWQQKKFLGRENCISIWHPPNRDTVEKISGEKSSRTHPETF